MTKDGVHPNDAGQTIYYETVKAVIDENIAASTGKMKDTDVINADVHRFDNFIWYGADTDFKRIDDTTFTLNASASGILGIDYTFESGDNKAEFMWMVSYTNRLPLCLTMTSPSVISW